LSSISKEAAKVCEIVLETCRAAAAHAKKHNTHPSVQRSLPIAVGQLWPDVALRDVIGICACAVFGLMYVPHKNNNNTQHQQQNSNNNDDDLQNNNNSVSNVFYLQLKEKEKQEKEKEKERKRQQVLKEQQSFTIEHQSGGDQQPKTPASSNTYSSPEKQEDFSIYYEGLSNATPQYSLSVNSVLKAEGTDLLNNATTFSLDVDIKNATRLGLECQVRKLLGDVFLALGNYPLDLLLPEVIEERKKQQQILKEKEHQQISKNNNSPTSGGIRRNNNTTSQQQQQRRPSSNSVVVGRATSPVSPRLPAASSVSPRVRSQTVAAVNNLNISNNLSLNQSQNNNNNSPPPPQYQPKIVVVPTKNVVADSSESEDEL
jgi:hypothetical protein